MIRNSTSLMRWKVLLLLGTDLLFRTVLRSQLKPMSESSCLSLMIPAGDLTESGWVTRFAANGEALSCGNGVPTKTKPDISSPIPYNP
jgi:hypothetical protein